MTIALITLVLLTSSCASVMPYTVIINPKPIPKVPKTFFEKTFPQAEPAWTTDRLPRHDRWEKPPLQVS